MTNQLLSEVNWNLAGKTAYDAFFDSMNGTDDFGRGLATWEYLSGYEQRSWIAVAKEMAEFYGYGRTTNSDLSVS